MRYVKEFEGPIKTMVSQKHVTGTHKHTKPFQFHTFPSKEMLLCLIYLLCQMRYALRTHLHLNKYVPNGFVVLTLLFLRLSHTQRATPCLTQTHMPTVELTIMKHKDSIGHLLSLPPNTIVAFYCCEPGVNHPDGEQPHFSYVTSVETGALGEGGHPTPGLVSTS